MRGFPGRLCMHAKSLQLCLTLCNLMDYISPGSSVHGGSVVKNLPAKARDTGDVGSILGSGRSPGVGNGNTLQYSCLENSIDREAWWSTVHGVTKNGTRLSMHAFLWDLCVYELSWFFSPVHKSCVNLIIRPTQRTQRTGRQEISTSWTTQCSQPLKWLYQGITKKDV